MNEEFETYRKLCEMYGYTCYYTPIVRKIQLISRRDFEAVMMENYRMVFRKCNEEYDEEIFQECMRQLQRGIKSLEGKMLQYVTSGKVNFNFFQEVGKVY